MASHVPGDPDFDYNTFVAYRREQEELRLAELRTLVGQQCVFLSDGQYPTVGVIRKVNPRGKITIYVESCHFQKLHIRPANEILAVGGGNVIKAAYRAADDMRKQIIAKEKELSQLKRDLEKSLRTEFAFVPGEEIR